MKTALEKEDYGVANMTADKCVEFQVSLSDAESVATTWRIIHMENIVNRLKSVIYCITSNDQMQHRQEFSIHLFKCDAWWEASSVHVLWKTIDKGIIHFGCTEMHLVSNMS